MQVFPLLLFPFLFLFFFYLFMLFSVSPSPFLSLFLSVSLRSRATAQLPIPFVSSEIKYTSAPRVTTVVRYIYRRVTTPTYLLRGKLRWKQFRVGSSSLQQLETRRRRGDDVCAGDPAVIHVASELRSSELCIHFVSQDCVQSFTGEISPSRKSFLSENHL